MRVETKPPPQVTRKFNLITRVRVNLVKNSKNVVETNNIKNNPKVVGLGHKQTKEEKKY
jgi:phosphotransferase system IIB component